MSEKEISSKPVRLAKWDLSKAPPPGPVSCTKHLAFSRKMLLVQTLLIMVSKTQPSKNSSIIFPSWAKPHSAPPNLWGAPSLPVHIQSKRRFQQDAFYKASDERMIDKHTILAPPTSTTSSIFKVWYTMFIPSETLGSSRYLGLW